MTPSITALRFFAYIQLIASLLCALLAFDEHFPLSTPAVLFIVAGGIGSSVLYLVLAEAADNLYLLTCRLAPEPIQPKDG